MMRNNRTLIMAFWVSFIALGDFKNLLSVACISDSHYNPLNMFDRLTLVSSLVCIFLFVLCCLI